MDVYEKSQGFAKKFLKKYKQGLIQYVPVTDNAGKAWKAGAAQGAPVTIDGVARGVSFKYIQRGLAVAGDTQVIMPGGGTVPDMKGYLTIDGDKFKIVSIVKKPEAGPVVVYVLIGRKGP